MKFTEDLVGSVAHVLAHRQELRGWLAKTPVTASPRVQALATQLLSEMRLPGKYLRVPGGDVDPWPCAAASAIPVFLWIQDAGVLWAGVDPPPCLSRFLVAAHNPSHFCTGVLRSPPVSIWDV